MSVSRNPARPVSDGPSYTPDSLPAYRGGGGVDGGGGGGGGAGCAYPLDALEPEMQAAGYTGKAVMSDGDQTATYTTQGGLGTFESYGGAPVNTTSGTGAKLDLTAGTLVAFEAQFPVIPALSVAAGAVIESALQVMKPDFTVSLTVWVAAKANGLYDLKAYNTAGVTIVADAATPPMSAAIVYDSVSGNLSVRYNGVEYLPTAGFTTAAVGILYVSEDASLAAGDAGKDFSVRLETSASAFLQTYTAGTTDQCGTAT